MRKLLTRTLLGLLIGAFFIWLSARDWPLDRLSGELRVDSWHLLVGDATIPTDLGDADGPSLTADTDGSPATSAGWAFDLRSALIFLVILSAIHVLRVVRWKPLLDPIVELDLRTHNRIGAVGFMAMFLFPLRLGELVRPYLVKCGTGKARMSEVLATVVVERVTDGLVVSLLLFCILPLLPASDPRVHESLLYGSFLALAVFGGASALLMAALWQERLTRALVDKTVGLVAPGVAHKINDLLGAFMRGLRALPSPRAFALFLLITVVYWGINGVGVWVMARGFYLPIDLVGGYAMMACVVVGMMIPNSPGNVGSFWYFLLVPLGLYSVTGSSEAIAFGITVWLFQLFQQTLFGAWFILTGQVSFGRVLAATSESEETLVAEAERPALSSASTNP